MQNDNVDIYSIPNLSLMLYGLGLLLFKKASKRKLHDLFYIIPNIEVEAIAYNLFAVVLLFLMTHTILPLA